MKFLFNNLSLLLLVVIITSTTACRKNCGCAPPPETYRHFSGSMNNKGSLLRWNETDFKDTVRNDSMVVWIKKQEYSYTVALKIDLKNSTRSADTYFDIRKFDASFYQYGLTPGGVSIYKLDNTANNFLKTRTLSGATEATKGQWLLGDFDLTFKLATLTGVLAIDTAHVYFPGKFGIKLDK